MEFYFVQKCELSDRLLEVSVYVILYGVDEGVNITSKQVSPLVST